MVEQEIKYCRNGNDAYCGSRKINTMMEEAGYILTDCIDVSLRCYLSLLYLKNEQMTMMLTLGIGDNKPIEVSSL